MNEYGAHPLRRLRLACLLAVVALGLAGPSPALSVETLSGVVNVNTASAEQLTLLPGVGESRAHAIVTLRESRGGFKTVDELLDVKGIGDVALTRLRPFVAVKGKTTLALE